MTKYYRFSRIKEICALASVLRRILEYGLWRYIMISDDRTCPKCRGLHGSIYTTEDEYNPVELSQEFEYGVLVSTTVFEPHVHVNCRCKIIRSYSGERKK